MTRPPFVLGNSYEIEIKHAGYYWVIRRRFARIHNLHRRLRLHALSLRLTRKKNLYVQGPDSFFSLMVWSFD